MLPPTILERQLARYTTPWDSISSYRVRAPGPVCPPPGSQLGWASVGTFRTGPTTTGVAVGGSGVGCGGSVATDDGAGGVITKSGRMLPGAVATGVPAAREAVLLPRPCPARTAKTMRPATPTRFTAPHFVRSPPEGTYSICSSRAVFILGPIVVGAVATMAADASRHPDDGRLCIPRPRGSFQRRPRPRTTLLSENGPTYLQHGGGVGDGDGLTGGPAAPRAGSGVAGARTCVTGGGGGVGEAPAGGVRFGRAAGVGAGTDVRACGTGVPGVGVPVPPPRNGGAPNTTIVAVAVLQFTVDTTTAPFRDGERPQPTPRATTQAMVCVVATIPRYRREMALPFKARSVP